MKETRKAKKNNTRREPDRGNYDRPANLRVVSETAVMGMFAVKSLVHWLVHIGLV